MKNLLLTLVIFLLFSSFIHCLNFGHVSYDNFKPLVLNPLQPNGK